MSPDGITPYSFWATWELTLIDSCAFWYELEWTPPFTPFEMVQIIGSPNTTQELVTVN